MFLHTTEIRVRYGETDKMGYVYYGNYLLYYEVGRVEAMRKLGISYKEVEEAGIAMPVYKCEVNYKKPAFYDDVLKIVVEIREMPTTKIIFHYSILKNNEIINEGFTTLVFIRMADNKLCRAPDVLVNALTPYFD